MPLVVVCFLFAAGLHPATSAVRVAAAANRVHFAQDSLGHSCSTLGPPAGFRSPWVLLTLYGPVRDSASVCLCFAVLTPPLLVMPCCTALPAKSTVVLPGCGVGREVPLGVPVLMCVHGAGEQMAPFPTVPGGWLPGSGCSLPGVPA